MVCNLLPHNGIKHASHGPEFASETEAASRVCRGAQTLMLTRAVLAFLVLAMPGATFAVNTPAPRFGSFAQREHQVSRNLTRASHFAGIPHVNPRGICDDVQPPQPLATPNPLFTPSKQGRAISVSFIVGTDGRVHSPLILESAGLAGDRHVLQTVRTWRYRPATCNGIPTETEGKIEFSSR